MVGNGNGAAPMRSAGTRPADGTPRGPGSGEAKPGPPALKFAPDRAEQRETTRCAGVIMRQCPTCRKIYPKALGDGGHCSARCRSASQINTLRAGLRLERLAHWLRAG